MFLLAVFLFTLALICYKTYNVFTREVSTDQEETQIEQEDE